MLLHYNHHGNYHHCLVLRWPCAVDRALNSNYQLITVMKLFIGLLQCIPCMDFYLIHNNVNCISPPPFQRSAWPSPSAWSRWTFLWPCRWPTGTRREVCWVISMASRVMTSSSPMELCWAATWQRGRSSKCSAVNVSSHKIHHNYEDCNTGVLRSVCKHSYNSNTQGNVILTCCLSSTNTFSSPLEYLGSDWTVASFSDRGLWILTSSQNTNIPTHVHYSRCYCRFVFRDSFTAVKLNECNRHFLLFF